MSTLENPKALFQSSCSTNSEPYALQNIGDMMSPEFSENSIIISGKIIQNANGKTFIVVQKGDALWNIAYQRLGVGSRYVDIVKLNKNTIQNPDLIYPGQVFSLPN